MKTIEQIIEQFEEQTQGQTIESFDMIWGTLTIAIESNLQLEDYHKTDDYDLCMITKGDSILASSSTRE